MPAGSTGFSVAFWPALDVWVALAAGDSVRLGDTSGEVGGALVSVFDCSLSRSESLSAWSLLSERVLVGDDSDFSCCSTDWRIIVR